VVGIPTGVFEGLLSGTISVTKVVRSLESFVVEIEESDVAFCFLRH
jgi:hypothetical protein